MIRAFAAIRDRYPKYTLTIYGEGELRTYLENLAKELGVSERVSLAGVIPDVAVQIERASLFLLTSYSEGVSNALIEALATGLPLGTSVEITGSPVASASINALDTPSE